MKKLLRHSLNISVRNWPVLLLFIVGYQGFIYSVFNAVMGDLMSYILKALGVPYIGAENFHLIFKSPVAIALFTVILLIVALAVFIEIAALYIYCEYGWQKKKLSILELLKCTLNQCKKLFKIQNIILFLGFILISVLTVLFFFLYLLQGVRIPEFIADFIRQNPLLSSIYGGASLLANIFCFFFLFSLPFIFFYEKTIKEAWKEMLQLVRKRRAATVFKVLGSIALFWGVMACIIGTAILSLTAYTKYALPSGDGAAFFTLYFNRSYNMIVFLLKTFSTVWIFSVFITLFHQYKEHLRPAHGAKEDKGRFYILKQIIMLACAIVLLLMFGESELGGSFIYNKTEETQVVAHRGGAAYAPENTLASLEAAIKAGADMVEIDVQQLKDGSLILLHDNNFKRTAEHDKDVWEVEYSEVKNYDAGSWFSPEFAGEPVPKLDDVLRQAKGRIDVMIELKLTGHEDRLVEQVLELITKNHMFDQCSIASLNLEVLREAKILNPKVSTAYITPLIFSGQYDIDFIDAFSVETTSMSREMVAAMQSQKKKVYGWTANSKETIEKNLRCQVNGVVTDDPELVKYYAQLAGESQLLKWVLHTFYK